MKDQHLKVGITLCKFAPFHTGHQFLIDSALKLVDKLIVVVYDCPDRIDVPLNTRCNWVRSMYPQVDVIEGWDAPNEHEDTEEVKRKQEQYIFKLLKGKKVTHFISSEYYGEHMSRFLKAENVIIDMKRAKINISSTMIRNDLYGLRNFVPSLVLKDLITKVVVLGAPSNKTEQLVSLSAARLDTKFVSDTSVGYFSQNKLDTPDIESVTKKRLQERALDTVVYLAKKSLIYNSSCLMDHVLSMAINREHSTFIYEEAEKEMRQFDLVFVDVDETNIISESYGIDNQFLLNQLLGNLNEMKIKYTLLSGTTEEKIEGIVLATHNIINLKKFS